MKSFIAFTLAALMVTLAACSNDTLQPAQPDVIMPLKVGNAWIGDLTTFNENGTVKKTISDTFSIIRASMIGSEQWFESNSQTLRTNRADGHWVQAGSHTWMPFKYPAVVGDTFNTDYFIETDEQGNLKPTRIFYMVVTATNKIITVPAGTFKCYEYTLRSHLIGQPGDTIMNDRYYLAPGKGIIKREAYEAEIRGGTFYLHELWVLTKLILN